MEELSLEEVVLFVLINFIIILMGIILYYYIWVKNYGVMIPIPQIGTETNLTFFNSKNFSIVISELWKRIQEFDVGYLLRSIGIEGYAYLLFQRKLISLIFTMSIFSFLFSFINALAKQSTEKSEKSAFQDFLLNNKYLNDFTTVIHLISVALFTFIHFRFFRVIKTEAKYLYFDRFDKMSRNKDSDWLSCRTLHVSGLAPNERNTSVLKRKLDLYLCEENCGRVIDIKFIPDYKVLLELERKRNEILDLRNYINKKENSFIRRWFFPKVFRTERSIQKELDKIEAKIEEATTLPVYSSGHAFVCFDSLLSAYKCLNAFKEGTWNKLNIQLASLWESLKQKSKLKKMKTSTFQKFQEEDLEVAMMDPEKVNLLVDQMIEPFDIIWVNVGGYRGIYIFRRILCNMVIFLVLIFLTTPTSMFSALKSMDYFSLLEFTWIIKVPYGYIVKTYLPPLAILVLNLLLIYLIDVLSFFEKHYTHSRFQYSVFTKSFFYMLLNFLIIPAITLTTADSLFSIIYKKIYDIPDLLSKIYLSNSGYFFVTLIIQNATISSVFYILRLDEIFQNSLSPFVAFYKRYFVNNGKQWHRVESDVFQFGYFYGQFLTFYTMALVFSTTVPFISASVFLLFILRHVVDLISLLSVHRTEMDSSGKLINDILNFSFIPVLLYHLCMMSFFLVKAKYYALIITAGIFLLSIIYTFYFNTKYLLDIYSLHEQLKVYEHSDETTSFEEINKWRNKYRHPLVIPISISSEEGLDIKAIEIEADAEEISPNAENSKNLNDSYSSLDNSKVGLNERKFNKNRENKLLEEKEK